MGTSSWCESVNCFAADRTNQTYCQDLNTTFNLTFGCQWRNSSGQELCDPNTGSSFFGSGCSDFNNNANGCFGTFFCAWNSTGNTCAEPGSGFGAGGPSMTNPSCGVITVQDLCINISGCSWDGTACSGNPGGILCSNLNKTICSDFTMLSTCCSWNGSNCKTSFDQACYNSVPSLPIGAVSCNDFNVFKNQSKCELIAASPWYMPCKWDNVSAACQFNSAGFGGSSGFDEMGSESGCEAQGGNWKTEQYIGAGGVTKTDTWCEFNFGNGGNCDSSCWGCELEISSSNTTAQAQTRCEGSSLGYCEFKADSNAVNTKGWCVPKQDFISGGGKSCSSDCGGCDFLTNPESKCLNSTKSCVWLNDSGASNGVGYCFGENEKRCSNDCFSCFTSTDCVNNGKGGNGACSWDGFVNYCKPVGFTGEVCFDAVDNDNDAKTDCADADCASDKFCGGDSLNDKFGDCPVYASNSTCTTAGCVWLKDDFEESFGGATSGRCDFPGSQCFDYDEAAIACNNVAGCSYFAVPGGTCEENSTLFDSCFDARNQSACVGIGGCGWNSGGGFGGSGGSGWCEPVIFAQCFGNQTRRQSQVNCEANYTTMIANGSNISTQICGWSTIFNPAGECQPVRFGKTNSTCLDATNGLCQQQAGLCEPTSFGGKCFQGDGNASKCEGLLNSTCTWFNDTRAGNNVSLGGASGWCESKADGGFFNFMGEQPPQILGDDGNQSGLIDSYDISSVGLRDDFQFFVLGTSIQDFSGSGICNNVPLPNGAGLGSGSLDYTFFWYLDTDGNTSNRCTVRDNSSLTGFEFSFKYQGNYTASLTEVKTAYQCVNGSWGAVALPLTSNNQKMCGVISGGMAGIDKVELVKFKGLYNQSKDIRIYATVSNITTNDSFVVDAAGPYYYTQGSFDFKFEDCSNPGGDSDGDGLTASNDPNCFDFLKFGFVPNEAGFQCKDSIDNDADGKTDCDDAGCSYDSYFCNGVLQPDANDKTSPKITWFQVDPFIDSAVIMYDTNEPANGTLSFYRNDSTCKTVNRTIRDVGLIDSFVQDHKLWHDAPIDNYEFNTEALGYALTNATTYYFKTTVCDISGNCAVSACLNLTTKGTVSNCKSCSSTFTFPFTPPTGSSVTNPLGNLDFKFAFAEGTSNSVSGNSSSGGNFNLTQMKGFSLVIQNPNATNTSNWRVTLVNASISGKVSTGVQNFTGGTDLSFNSTTNGTFVGLGNTKCQELINTFRPKKLEIGVPGNVSDLWQCTSSLTNCVNKTANATRVLFNESINMTLWRVPAEWGC